ncbi:MAG: hypothetical protein ABIW33_06580 [Sphingomicrobium sp.]
MRRALPFTARTLALALTSLVALGACSTPGGPYPSLGPRPGEAIDPRIAVVRPINDRPVTAGLESRLAGLVAAAQRGQSEFAPLASQAERLAASAGKPQSDGWVAAEQALSAAVAAREATARALGDVDAIEAEALATNGGIAPNDLAAITRAQADIGSLDQRQSGRIKALQKRLGS